MMIENKKKLIKALEQSLGIITSACKACGLSRETYYRFYRTDDEFKKQVDSINDYTLDFVENQLLKKIKEGDSRSILFYMKYKGRERGYNDQMTLNIKVEQPLLAPLKDDILEIENDDDIDDIEDFEYKNDE